MLMVVNVFHGFFPVLFFSLFPPLSVRIYCLPWTIFSLLSWQMFAHCMKYWRAKTDSSHLAEGQCGDLSILGIFCLPATDGLIQTEIQFPEIFFSLHKYFLAGR